jgi:hypothetical protein
MTMTGSGPKPPAPTRDPNLMASEDEVIARDIDIKTSKPTPHT